uniref:Mediator of RNA polymerase II transcription subunit 25 n=1 Tax=Brassica campestris TaxID=3711 RepID=M4E7I2_BRACM
MSSELKQLIVVVEGTAALGPYWQTIVSDYLLKIIRSFCGTELNGERNPVSNVELSLVIFNSHGSYCACLVQRSGWTKDVNIFLRWLSSIQFAGGGFNEAATAEGLAEALMMFSPPSGQAQPSNDLKRHCILITASNPYSLPTPVYRPKLQNPERYENGHAQSESRLSDAETVASYFSRCSVSLSVVCPKQLPKIRALYNAGKPNAQSADLSIDTVKNAFYLVLISENFVEARAALSHSATNFPQTTQSPVKVDRATVAPSLPVTGQPLPPVPSANGPIMNRQPVSVGPVPTATVKVEPGTISSMAAVPTFPHIPSVARPATQAIPSVQTSSASPVSQEMVTKAENAPDIKPVVGGMTPQLRTGPPGGANVNLLNNLSQVRQVMSSAALAGASSSGQSAVAMHMSNMISTGMATSLPPSQTAFSSGQQGNTSMAGSGALAGTEQAGQSPAPNNAFSPQTTSNLGVSQPMQGMNQGSHSGAQMMQSGISMNQNMMSQGNVSSGTGGMMPTPGVGQQTQSGIQQLGGSNSSAPNVQLSQPSSGAMQPSQSKYVKVWEGNLSGQRQGQPVLITRLEGYRSASASDSLAANWPPNMQIVRLISQDHMNNKQYVGKADFLVFRAMSQHGFLGQLQDKKLCAVIQLPSQTLLLSVSDKACRLIGMLFPGDMVVFKPQIQNQQQQQLQQQQQIQQQQQQQQIQQQQQQQIQQQHHHQQQQLPQLQQQQQHQMSQLQHHQQQQLSQLHHHHQQQQQHQMSQLQHHQQQQLPQLQQQRIRAEGLRLNRRVGIEYLAVWLTRSGSVPRYNLMEDAAPAEISRVQNWQWIRYEVELDGDGLGVRVNKELFERVVEEEMERIEKEVGKDKFKKGMYKDNCKKFTKQCTASELDDFLTLAVYDHIVAHYPNNVSRP